MNEEADSLLEVEGVGELRPAPAPAVEEDAGVGVNDDAGLGVDAVSSSVGRMAPLTRSERELRSPLREKRFEGVETGAGAGSGRASAASPDPDSEISPSLEEKDLEFRSRSWSSGPGLWLGLCVVKVLVEV